VLGLVEMAVYRLPDAKLLVQPRVSARTANIERGVIRVVDGVPAPDVTGQPATAHKQASAARNDSSIRWR
jgi:hypothetical protein